MFSYHCIIATIFLFKQADKSIAQIIGGTTAGGSFVCVPPGYCNNNAPRPTGGIDPRIVTPEQCPQGSVACFTQGSNSQCGVRFVSPVATADGTASNGAYPWQAYLRNASRPFLGSGVLLDNYRVLTAAHKILQAGTITVIMGVYNPTDLVTNTQQRQVAGITVHPEFNTTLLRNDLAILTVSSPFSLSQANINTACLANPTMSFVGQRCTVAGWGQTSFNINDAPRNPMKQVTVPIVDSNTCRTSYLQILQNTVDLYLDRVGEICAGGEDMRDACTQDGGSPLMCTSATDRRAYIAGLVIWGKGCGVAGVFGVYANVPYYRPWIEGTIVRQNAG